MFSVLLTPIMRGVKSAARPLAAVALALTLTACEAPNMSARGPSLNGGPVQVALLVPGGSAKATDNALAGTLENAARLAMGDLQGVEIDLRVYNTGGTAAGAGVAATNALDDGAKIILGPLYAANANAAGLIAAKKGVNVLTFSNDTSIAGGNVFVLGQTFDDTANRLARYATLQGKGRTFIVHANSPSEVVGAGAISRAITRQGGALAGSASFELSQQSLINALTDIAQQVRATEATSVFFTSGNDGAMPFLAQLLPENGVSPTEIQYIGLRRLDLPAQALSQPGLQGSWFTIPDPARSSSFTSRYSAAYGTPPPAVAGLAYDGIAAIGASVRQGNADALSREGLTQGSGFVGVNGVFRLYADGTNERGLAVATIQDGQVVVLDPAPRGFASAGF
jgi:hypothetical protein